MSTGGIHDIAEVGEIFASVWGEVNDAIGAIDGALERLSGSEYSDVEFWPWQADGAAWQFPARRLESNAAGTAFYVRVNLAAFSASGGCG